eukprot:Nitzschia sp. Nitz4//scaffold227_size32659//1084//3924//NITZ4_007893-RA/size32659-processed-gene-0.0-mRNA-1//1//CDS//3329542779//873//frame0
MKSDCLIPEGFLPSYLATAFGELYEEDGLAVLAKGLGWLTLLATFCRFYADVENGHVSVVNDETNTNTIKPPLVLVLGLRETECDTLISMLTSWGTPHSMIPTVLTNESGQGKDRETLYQRGGVFCVTSRILIVDLLTNTLESKDIDGVLVAHADQVTAESTEAFILRIYTSQKRRDRCFIKALTESPEGMLAGFSKVDKTLKALQVRRMYLYPRFHDAVQQDLEKSPPKVVELHQALSPNMLECQSAIVAAVKTCMRELQASTPFVEWTSADLSIENCVMSNFDFAVKRQLDPDWHRLKPQTKQLVADLSQLRKLFQGLIQYDCIGFWKFINALKSNSAAARNPSLWLLTPAADRLFQKAKERVYKIEKGVPTTQVPNPVSRLVPVLEENPKWRLLKSVLTEIEQKEANRAEPRNATVLVLVKEAQSIERLTAYLVHGRDRAMARRFLMFLEYYNDRTRSIAASVKVSEESRLLLEEEQRLRNVLRKMGWKRPADQTTHKLNEVPAHIRKRRKIALEHGRGTHTGSRDDLERQAVLEEAIEEVERDQADPDFDEKDVRSADDILYDTMFQPRLPIEPRVVFKSLSSLEGDSGMVLSDIDPDYAIMFDMDVSLVRSLEVLASLDNRSEEEILQVYFLMYEASSEQKVFQKSLEREQSAFVRLIHHKKTMPPPALHIEGTQEMQEAYRSGGSTGSYAGGALPLAFDSRRAKKTTLRRDVAVDVREFRSALPSILHQGGMRLAPVTLTVGDFVLSNVHCVERKSISDLFGSFASGRLYTQAEAMSKYYACPMLLIEFDPSKRFCLQNSNELGMDIRMDSACSKIVLLTRHFPKLRILWSKSPQDTLKIFQQLKASHGEVDVDKAVEVGRSESVEALLDNEDEVNEVARDMLLRLPGVNVHNARRIMRECESLSDLIKMDRNELRRVAGPVAGQKLFTFFSQTYASASR